MTGFGKGNCSNNHFTVTTEIKSVNHRFKDFRFKMGSAFNAVEIDLRNKLEEEFKRGSFDVSISYKRNEQNKEFLIDEERISSYMKLMLPLFQKYSLDMSLSPTDFLRSDFSKEEDEDLKGQELLPLMWKSFYQSVTALKQTRSQEGSKLVAKLIDHLDQYEKSLKKVEALKSEYPQMVKDKLTAKLNEKILDFKIDESRMMQEIVYYLEKLEVDEEINRAKIHITKLRGILQSSGEVGRQIDFLLQELGRETNTLGSKSAHSEISSLVVEMKVQLEKIREQALNLE